MATAFIKGIVLCDFRKVINYFWPLIRLTKLMTTRSMPTKTDSINNKTVNFLDIIKEKAKFW